MRSPPGRPRAAGAPLLAFLLALLAAGCATGGGAGSDFREGLTALDGDRPEEALGRLERVREVCGTSPLAQQAVLVEAAAALGGRVGERDPQRAAVLTAAFLRQATPPAWGVPIAESLYLMSQEMGAEAPSEEATTPVFDEEASVPATGCGPRWDDAEQAANPVPSLEGTGVADELRRLQSRMAELEEEVERLRALLKVPQDGGP